LTFGENKINEDFGEPTGENIFLNSLDHNGFRDSSLDGRFELGKISISSGYVQKLKINIYFLLKFFKIFSIKKFLKEKINYLQDGQTDFFSQIETVR
jgi:hypothetical protein